MRNGGACPCFPFIYQSVHALNSKKKPVIFSVHNVMSHEAPFLYFKASQLLFKLGDYFIVHSKINKQQMAEFYGIPLDKIAVIPHGSLDFHVKKKSDRNTLRKKMGIKPEHKIILLFGAIRPYKGIDTAIKAFAEVINEIPTSRLLIAGRLWESWTPYEQLINKLGLKNHVITHLDYIPSGDVHKFYEVSDLCVFPYHHFDSQSGAGATAISFRKPMIVSNVGGLPDLVNDKRSIFEPGDDLALSNAVTMCLKDPAVLESMKSDAEIVSARFTWPEIAKKTDKIYKKLLKPKF